MPRRPPTGFVKLRATSKSIVITLADRSVRVPIGSPDLSPTRLAALLGVSRPTLYRAFAKQGGISQRVQEMRLVAMRKALANPKERRKINELATLYGFASLAHFSRSFQRRFGQSPRELRVNMVTQAREGGSPEAPSAR